MTNSLMRGDGIPHRQAEEDCTNCTAWELRHQVAVRATYYLSLHIREIGLRLAVLEQITAAWALCVHDGISQGGFQGFFARFCEDVERGVDPSKLNTPEHSAEYRRVWTDYARRLYEASLVTPGGTAPMV